MKLLMTTDTVGGVWTFAVQLCRALEPLGVRVTLATMGRPLSDAQWAEVSALRSTTVRASAFRLEWMADAWHDVAAAGDWLLALEDETRPDIVHLNAYAHGALPWGARVLMTGHSCVLSWWRAVHGCDAPPAEWERYRAAVTAGIRAADFVTAPTRTMLDSLLTCYGPLPRTAVVPNGIEPDPGRTTAGHPLVVAAGRVWDAAKNIGALALAARTIRWPVLVAGDDVGDDGARRQIDGVRLLGPLSRQQLDALYRRARILVHPALYEPFGLVPLEAALRGCALVLADIESLREVWHDAAVYVDPRDPAAIAAGVNRLIERPAQTAELAAAARSRAQAFRADVMAHAYFSAYRHLTAGAQHGRAPCTS
jgi:glycogen synthase